MPFHEKRCPSCKSWTDGSQKVCSHCGERLYAQEERERKLRKSVPSGFETMLVKIKPDDHPAIKVAKRVLQGGQLIYFGLVYLITWFVTWVVG